MPNEALTVPSRRPPEDRGAAAVEGAAVVAFILTPLLLGILAFGFFFWKAQYQPPNPASSIGQGDVAGYYTCSELVSRVKQLTSGNLSQLAQQYGVDPSTIQQAVSVVPTVGAGASVGIGANVTVTYTIPSGGPGGIGSLVPDPIVISTPEYLQSVQVSTTSC